MRKIVSRPDTSALPALPLPVYIRSAGYNEAESGWQEYDTDKPFVQIFWCVQGAGEFFLTDGSSVTVHPGDTFFRMPGEIHHHRSCDPVSPWSYYWFTFDGPSAREFMLAYGYRQIPMYAGECPVELFLELEIMVRKPEPYAQRHAISLAAEILAQMGGREKSAPAEHLVRRYLGVAKENMRNPEITVESLARRLGVHRTTLNRHFKAEMGISPGAYLDTIRLQHALRLLRDTAMNLKEIPQNSGLLNQSYFCALVKKATGMSPKQYRESLNPQK